MTHHHGCDLRKGRVSIPGQIYLVTTVSYQRQPIFKIFYKRSLSYTFAKTRRTVKPDNISIIRSHA